MDNRNQGIDVLRFIAIILVINSHMDMFYPIPNLATGGALGNSIFFMLSSFGLLLSERNKSQSFVEYILKRIKRIYPTVWLISFMLILPMGIFYSFYNQDALTIFFKEYRLSDPLTFATILFYPPPAFWFLQALMVFYVFGFFFIRHFTHLKFLVGFISLIAIYAIMYVGIDDFSILVIEQEIRFKLVFYAMVFLFGLYLSARSDQIYYAGFRDFVTLIILLIIIYGHKLLAALGHYQELQFIQQFAIFPVLYFAIKLARINWLSVTLSNNKWLAGSIGLVAAMTLELYIVHGPVRELLFPYVGSFPFNVLVYLGIVFAISYIFYRMNQRIITKISS